MIGDITLESCKKVDSEAKYISSYAKSIQGDTEPYGDFVGRLQDLVERQVEDIDSWQCLIRILAIDNANGQCQPILNPIREKECVMG